MGSAEDGALSGIRVIDFGQYISGPLAAMLLADNGAEIIRVEPPSGPFLNHPANAILQRGKASVALDLRTAADVDVARQLIESADVVIDNFRPGVMERLGLCPEEAVRAQEGLIWCSIPGFGKDDPRAELQAWEGLVCSAAGLYPESMTQKDGIPRFSALPMASTFAGFIAAHSIVAALISRHRFGHGDLVEVPMFDAAFEAISFYGEDPTSLQQIMPKFKAERISNPAFHVSKGYRARDGRPMAFAAVPPRGMHRFWDEYLPVELKNLNDEASVAEATLRLREVFSRRDSLDWERHAQEELHTAFATCQTTAEWLYDEHALDSGAVISLQDHALGATRQAGFGVCLSETPSSVRFSRRPVDADGDAVRATLEERAQRPNRSGDTRDSVVADLPLSGHRAVDFSHLLAGPIGCRVLADYGADVIKVNNAALGFGLEDPQTDDPIALIGHRTASAGKRTIFLNLKSAEGRKLAEELVRTADIVHVNCTEDAADRLGIDEPVVRQARSDVIYSTMSLHGQGGWRSAYRGHEDLAEAVTGLSHRFGGGTPQMHGILVNDHATGHLAAFGILLAVFHRYRTGEGQTVESSLTRTATLHQLPYMIDFFGQTWNEPVGRHATGYSQLDGLFETLDGYIYVVCNSEDGRGRLAALLGSTDSNSLEDRLAKRLKQYVANLDSDTCVERFLSAGVPAHAYIDIPTLMKSPLAIERGLSVRQFHPGLGEATGVGLPARFASMPDRRRAPASAPGMHTLDILAELGRRDDAASLLRSRVVSLDYESNVREGVQPSHEPS